MPEAHADGLAIRYDDTGEGEPPLLCLPGWCAGRAAFHDFARRIAPIQRFVV